jgi:hypothetical protein
MAATLIPDEMHRYGLKLAGFNVKTQQKIHTVANMKRFRDWYGVGPKSCSMTDDRC